MSALPIVRRLREAANTGQPPKANDLYSAAWLIEEMTKQLEQWRDIQHEAAKDAKTQTELYEKTKDIDARRKALTQRARQA